MTTIKFAGHLAVSGLLFVVSGWAWAGTEGASNTSYGQSAGGSFTSGALNTVIGVSAGAAVGTGERNTLIGYHSGSNMTIGASNTLVGVGAGTSSNGSFNTYVGDRSGIDDSSGVYNTFVGNQSGQHNQSGYYSTYLGAYAGSANTNGQFNNALGAFAGYSNSSGNFNVYLGSQSGQNNVAGSNNIFIGNAAGYTETGSNRLYIDPCLDGAPCTNPFIYGEFDTNLLKINAVAHVAANAVPKSQMHFSLDNGDYGGFLTSVLPNNFFVSSGARYDSGNWVQRSPDGNAVMAGSGGQGYRIFTHTSAAVGSTFTNLDLRLQIDYSGRFGINTTPVAGDEIHTSSGAHLTSGGVWTDASSREYKEHIRPLTTEEAQQTLAALDPVRYNYKANPREKHVGFIAEDVPELVAREDRKSLSPMDIVAVLTKVVQEKSQVVDEQRKMLTEQGQMLQSLAALVERHETELKRLKGKDLLAQE